MLKYLGIIVCIAKSFLQECTLDSDHIKFSLFTILSTLPDLNEIHDLSLSHRNFLVPCRVRKSILDQHRMTPLNNH